MGKTQKTKIYCHLIFVLDSVGLSWATGVLFVSPIFIGLVECLIASTVVYRTTLTAPWSTKKTWNISSNLEKIINPEKIRGSGKDPAIRDPLIIETNSSSEDEDPAVFDSFTSRF